MMHKQFALLALTALSLPALALESMSDASLSDTTGQDGVTITIAPPAGGITAQMILHDTDGLTPNGTKVADGALVFGDGTAANNFKIAGGNITLDIDADGGSGTTSTTGPVLNIKIGLPSSLTINTGTISVAKSSGMGAALTNTTKILDNITVALGGLNVNMQLGAEAQGSMLKVSGAVTNGITLNNFALFDNWNGTTAQTNVGIGAASIKIKDNGAGANLTLTDVRGDVTAGAGLLFTLTDIGAASSAGIDIQMTGVKLGDQTAATKLGNLELRGLNLNGATIGIKGH